MTLGPVNQRMIRSYNQFQEELGLFYREEVLKSVPKVTRFAAAVVIRHLLKRSPVLTGSYMLSHRVNKKIFDTSYVRRPQKYNPVTQQPIRANRNRIQRTARTRIFRKLKTIQLRIGDTLQVSNSIPYVKEVEFGWPTAAGKQVYNLAFINALKAVGDLVTLTARYPWHVYDRAREMMDRAIIRELTEEEFDYQKIYRSEPTTPLDADGKPYQWDFDKITEAEIARQYNTTTKELKEMPF